MSLSKSAVSRLQQLAAADDPRAHDRYLLQEVIGRGGMGTVYRAHDAVLGRDVAFKVFDSNATNSSSARERFHREASVLAQLEHPGIVPVHDAGELADGRSFHVMQLVRGVRLDEHSRTGISRGDALRLLLRLSETVAFANARGVVHRDLKPGNIMVGPFGEVLVLDWGVAKVASSVVRDVAPDHRMQEAPDSEDATLAEMRVAIPAHDTQDGAVIGTRGYMSPEQQSGNSNAVDQRADVYALGVIMRELVASTTEGSNRVLDSIAQRATQARPADRYTSAVEFAEDIRRWLDGRAVTSHEESVLERFARFYRLHQVAILLVVTYLVVRVTILLWRNI